MAQFSFIPTTDAADFAGDIRRLFDELADTLGQGQRVYSGECRPTVDVLETDAQVEVLVDLAGIPAAALRVAFRDGVLLIVGEKAPPVGSHQRAHHLVEREFGRFARAVPITGAFDLSRAHASLRNGELLVRLPKISDRRGQIHRIRIDDPSTPR